MHPRIPNTIPRIPKMPSELELLVDSVVVAGAGDGDAVVPVGVGLGALSGDGVVPVPGVPPEAGVGELGELGDVDGVEGVPDPPPVAVVGLGVLWDGVGTPAGVEPEPPVAPVAPAAPIRYPFEHCTEDP